MVHFVGGLVLRLHADCDLSVDFGLTEGQCTGNLYLSTCLSTSVGSGELSYSSQSHSPVDRASNPQGCGRFVHLDARMQLMTLQLPV